MKPDLSDEDIADLAKLIKRAIDDSRHPPVPGSPRVEGAARQAQTGAGCASRRPYVMAATPKRHCGYSIASAELAGCPNEGTHWLEGWGADLADGWYCQTHATELTRLREEQARNRTRIWNWFKQAVGKF
jgi:hypothetical protein